jgi:hypothetical protein
LNFQIAELGQLFAEVEADRPRRPVTMLSHQNIGNVLAVGVFDVVVFAINEEDDVSVLLNAVMDNDVIRNKVMIARNS